MNEWVSENPAIAVGVGAGLAAAVVLLFVLWMLSLRNSRLLSRELDDADREISALDTSVAEQGARLRIVRELHDVAVHSISGIARQAEGTRYVVETDPSAAARAAAQIAERATSTLADLRRIVTVAAEGEAAVRTSSEAAPSIAAVDDLLASSRAAGLKITVSETGERFDLQVGADTAIYRILEEALANALTYGGVGTDVTVSFIWTAEGLQLLVDDDGVQAEARRAGIEPGDVDQLRRYTFQEDLAALTDTVGGEGMAEMRQRASAFGGVFKAYPVPGVGFSVSAIFPALRYDNGVHGVNLAR